MATLVGKQAPDFKAQAVIGSKIVDNFSLEHYRGKNVVFFFYPLNFTFVCPTELHAFQDAMEEFEKRETQVIAIIGSNGFINIRNDRIIHTAYSSLIFWSI